MTDFTLGTYHKYLVMDMTSPRHDWMTNPVQDHTVPFYLGLGPEVPTSSFVHDKKDFEVVRVVEVGDPHNPFPCPVVMSRRIKRSK